VAARISVAPSPEVDTIVLCSLYSPNNNNRNDNNDGDDDGGAANALHPCGDPYRGASTSSGRGGAPSPIIMDRRSRALLKSAVQKCVRRRMGTKAARFTRALMDDITGVDDLLRRATVILIEDAVVAPHLPVIVWLMAAHAKGFVLCERDVNLIASLMERAAALDVCDCVPPIEPNPAACARLGAPGNHPIVDALLLRVCYGGTSGDMRMLARAASLWQARFDGPSSALWQQSLSELYGRVKPTQCMDENAVQDAACYDAEGQRRVSREIATVPTGGGGNGIVSLIDDIPIEAADFHCFPRMCADVAKAAGGGSFTPELVRETIWHHRSSINLKRLWIDSRRPLEAPSPHNQPSDCMPDDRVNTAAVLRTARCWTTISEYVDRAARRSIQHVASTLGKDSPTVTDRQSDTVLFRARDGRKRAHTATIPQRECDTSERLARSGQRSIRSYFVAASHDPPS
jgi:hypothetical protein